MSEFLRLFIDQVSTPIGRMQIVADENGDLRVAFFADDEDPARRELQRQYGERGFTLSSARNPYGLADAVAQYFAGHLDAIDFIPVEADGTPFQRTVWHALREIPCGTTLSYGKLAERIGNPTAVRAVGLANGAHPVAVVVPCHRVIGANGSLTGYGGGIERKRWLLDHEKTQRLF
jgi:methylated-DNA-[protein]-cysteine S-methyltransferase